MKSTFTLLLSSLLLTSSFSFAAPSQLVFGDKSLTSSASRDPDFVDILESQSSFNDKLQELIQDAQELSKQVITESYSKVADLSNQAEIEALLIAASLEDKVMEILPLPQDGDHHDQNGITKGLKSGLNHSKKPLKNDVSIPDLPNWGAFKNLNADTQLDAPSPPGGGWVWSSCGQSQDAVIVQDIEVTPDPPRPGQNLTVHAKGIVNSKLENGTYADVVVKLGLIKLLTRRFDVCEEAKKNDAQVQCPVAPGPYEIEQTVALPREIPPAKFNVHVTGGTQDDEDLLCLDLSINFMHRS